MRTLRSLAKPAVPLVALGAALWLATPAFAHINPDPPAVEAGKATTVGFNVEHGCAESPTTSLDIQLPAGTNDAPGSTATGSPRRSRPTWSPSPVARSMPRPPRPSR